jgi:osmotically-inducible protein OsmY
MADARLKERVQTALKQNPYLAGRNLRFEADHGRIKLSGVVRSYFQKQMAQEALRRIEGVREVLNEIEVAQERHAGT